MIKTKKYRNLISVLTENKKSNKEIWKQINDIHVNSMVCQNTHFTKM